METKMGDTKEFMKLIGLKWTILYELYLRECSQKEISDKIGRKPPWISSQLKILKANGLVTFRGGDDGRSKLYRLEENCRKIIDAIIKAQITPEETEKLPPEPLKLIIKAVKDDELPAELRSEAVSVLIRLCSPENKNKTGGEILREFFLEVTKNLENYVDKPKPRVLTALENYITYKLDRAGLFWFKKECYQGLLFQFEKEKRIEVRMSSIRILVRIYTQYMNFLIKINVVRQKRRFPKEVEEFTSVTSELSKLFMETLFDPEEDEEIAYKSWEILSSAKGTEQKDLLAKLYEGVKAGDERTKKRCAKLLKEFLESYDAVDTKGKNYEVGKDNL